MDGHENVGYRRLFGSADDPASDSSGFTVGLAAPFGPVQPTDATAPPIDREVALARRAATLGFDGLWVRDVPLYWPRFRDAGQVYDPWVYLTHLAAQVDDVALATASIVLPLRHPLHVAKSAASLDRLSGGRLVLGVGSGDRPPEFAAFGLDHDERGARFRESVTLLRTVWSERFAEDDSRFGALDGSLDVQPTPTTRTLPLLVTGNARQSVAWIGEHADGWLFYQLPLSTLDGFLDQWRAATVDAGHGCKPFVMGLGVELCADPTAPMEHVHQGFRAGSEWFVDYFSRLGDRAVDHVIVSLRDLTGNDGRTEPAVLLDRFASEVLDEL